MIQPPEYAALIDPITCAAYALRFQAREDLVQTLYIGTGELWGATITAMIVDDTVHIPQSDAMMFIAPFVKLVMPVKASYAGAFLLSRLTVKLDGETVVNKQPVDRYLVAPPFQIAQGENREDPLVCVGLPEKALLGTCELHFLKDKSRVEISIEGVPSGAGDIRLVGGAILGRYTTKAKAGALYAVGRLDPVGQVYPETRSWDDFMDVINGPVMISPNLTQSHVEAAFGDALKNLLNEKELEIRRLKEDADLREKAQQKLKHMEIQRREEATHDMARQKLKEIQERIKPPPTKTPSNAPKEPAPAVNFDAALARARSRLVTYGLVALGIFVTIALVLLSLSRSH